MFLISFSENAFIIWKTALEFSLLVQSFRSYLESFTPWNSSADAINSDDHADNLNSIDPR